jgi:nicotinamide-nucleotide amidase
MRAEIISIGDEMTSGQRLDTNSQWLSQRLGEIGVEVIAHATVADNFEANVEIFRQAVERADVIISTGGLGPTADDLTREVLARLLGVELQLDEHQLSHIRSLFERRKRPMPERNIVQAMFPIGSRPIDNPEGTAPGVDVEIPRRAEGTSRVFALPGVPAEMFEMWASSVRPALIGMGAGQQVLVHRRIKCFGLGESELEQRLPDLIRRGRVPQVGITVSDATITLRITASGATETACDALIQPTVDTIHECLGTIVFGAEDDELEHAVLRLLADRRQTLATCEWGTMGTIARWLSEAPDSSSYLGGEVVTNAAAAGRIVRADVEPGESLSGSMVEALARGCRQRYQADYALVVGPFPSAADSASPEVQFALATADSVTVKLATLGGHPAIVRPRAAKQALNLLRLRLLHPT